MAQPSLRAAGTLRLARPWGGTLRLAGTFLLGSLAVVEGLLRMPVLGPLLPSPGLGTSLPGLEVTVDRLEHLVDADGPPDCLVLGNSFVSYGVDPRALSEGFREETGRSIRCFNAGIAGLSTALAGGMAEVLVGIARPRLVLYLTTARDLLPGVDEPLRPFLATAPWVRQQLGEPSLRGWLAQHSRAYRLATALRRWLDPRAWRAFADEPHRRLMTAEGFVPLETRAMDLGRVVVPPENPLRALTRTGYRVAPEARRGLERLFALRAQGVAVVVVEAPTHPAGLAFLEHGEEDRRAFEGALGEATRAAGVPFWPASLFPDLPPDGWVDPVHMNRRGGAEFGRRLGRRVGRALRAGEIREFPANY